MSGAIGVGAASADRRADRELERIAERPGAAGRLRARAPVVVFRRQQRIELHAGLPVAPFSDASLVCTLVVNADIGRHLEGVGRPCLRAGRILHDQRHRLRLVGDLRAVAWRQQLRRGGRAVAAPRDCCRSRSGEQARRRQNSQHRRERAYTTSMRARAREHASPKAGSAATPVVVR